MAFNSENTVPLWDFTSPGLNRINDDDFLSLLQKQFGLDVAAPNALDASAVPVTDNFPLSGHGNGGGSVSASTGVDPQNLFSTHMQESPPSDDTSPSPPGGPSRRQSTIYDGDMGIGDDGHKRKASDDDDLDQEEGPSHKSQHTSRKASSSRRKSGTNQDEARLMKRKEQNRAAQRAFRERKEKHVKDLEDKVAALEEKNAKTAHENENLRELLGRLQQENVSLKQQPQFTFSVPKPASSHGSPFSPTSTQSSTTIGGIDWGNLPVYDSTTLNLIENDPVFAAQMGFTPSFRGSSNGPMPMMGIQNTNTMMTNNTPYMTIASNPLYMSFADPPAATALASPANSSGNNSSSNNSNSQTNSSANGANAFDSFSGATFTPWPDTSTMDFATPMSLDDIFGSSFIQPQPALDFSFPPSSRPSPGSSSSLSPVVHHKSPASSLTSGSGSGSGSSPAATCSVVSSDGTVEQRCPKTKGELAEHVTRQGMSTFAANSPLGDISAATSNSTLSDMAAIMRYSHPSRQNSANSVNNNSSPSSSSPSSNPSSNSPNIASTTIPHHLHRASTGGTKTVGCKTDGSSLPKTEMHPSNIEVLDAWREVTSDPAFKEHDLTELCTLFTSKARCDGQKVVLEPKGMEDIKMTLATKDRSAAANQKEFKI